MTLNPLTREQKLMAEQVVQLGNIVEMLHIIAHGGEDNTALLEQISTLQNQLAASQAATAAAQTEIASLQQQLADCTSHQHDPTPDDVTEVMNHLGIEYQNDPV